MVNYPTASPGYDPNTWKQGRWWGRKWHLQDVYTEHREDRSHWRHWDIRDKNGKDKGSFPKNSKKRRPNQKRKPQANQCDVDPSRNAPEWQPKLIIILPWGFGFPGFEFPEIIGEPIEIPEFVI